MGGLKAKAKRRILKGLRAAKHAERRLEAAAKRALTGVGAGAPAASAPAAGAPKGGGAGKAYVHPWTLQDVGRPRIVDELRKKHCCGCGSCAVSCPKRAISLQMDEEGFYYPHIDHAVCIECGVCVRHCPVLVEQPPNDEVDACHAQWSNDDVRLASSSGGMFTELARYAFSRGGVVFGAAYDEDLTVRHAAVFRKEDLAALRGSKYVQSQAQESYPQVRDLLRQGRFVLYSGCPCQVAGLYAFLGKSDDPNLLTVDLLCHGTPSPGLFARYLAQDYEPGSVADVGFRDKSAFGWSSNLTVRLKDGAVLRAFGTRDPYYRMFSACLANRPFCSVCKFARLPRVGDLTIGDWWGVGAFDGALDDGNGTSLVMVNNARGRAVYDELSPAFAKSKEFPLDQAIPRNGAIDRPLAAHSARARFFQLLETQPFDKAVGYALDYRFDVGVFGLWYGENYGSVLTYFGLMKVLESMGLAPCLIANPLGSARADGLEPTAFARRRGFFITARRPIERMGECNAFCDTFVVGSDQLWNPGLSRPYRHAYFLSFAADDKKRVAYGTSFGKPGIPVDARYKERSRWELSKFDALSVRDDFSRDILRKDYGLDAAKVLDPALLCDPEEYRALAASAERPRAIEGQLPPLEAGGYLFAYILDLDERTVERLAQVARAAGRPVVAALDMDYSKAAANRERFVGSSERDVYALDAPRVEQWLFCLAHADAVLTDSFHGTLFSHVMGRDFVALPNARRGADRFTDVLGVLGLEDRILPGLDAGAERIVGLLDTPIDFSASNARLQPERERSGRWLREALFAPKEVRTSCAYPRVESRFA